MLSKVDDGDQVNIYHDGWSMGPSNPTRAAGGPPPPHVGFTHGRMRQSSNSKCLFLLVAHSAPEQTTYRRITVSKRYTGAVLLRRLGTASRPDRKGNVSKAPNYEERSQTRNIYSPPINFPPLSLPLHAGPISSFSLPFSQRRARFRVPLKRRPCSVLYQSTRGSLGTTLSSRRSPF